MRKVLGIAWIFLLLAGCSASMDSALLQLDGRVSSPLFEGPERQAVVYPATAKNAGHGDEVMDAYGPAWQDMQAEYPEYRFN